MQVDNKALYYEGYYPTPKERMLYNFYSSSPLWLGENSRAASDQENEL